MTSWSHWRRRRFWVEIVLAVVVGVAAFVVAALVSTAARSHVPAVLLGLLLLLAVLAVARFAGILYALPVGVVIIEAFDWYFLPPLRALDAATVLVLGLFLAMAVIVGAVATQAGRRAAGSEQARGVLADEQTALRRVATLVGRQPSPAELFAAVTEEAGKLLDLDSAHLVRYERDETATVVGAWGLGATVECATSKVCPDVAESDDVFGSYIGHDEPSAVFYSNKPGSGNHMQYSVRLPGDPSPQHPNTKSYQQELNATFWFGLALCDTQSYPEQVSTCKPDSDSNIVDPAVSPKHPGTAFMELQFYPPGWVPWPTWAVAAGAGACDPTKWCAAMNIFGLSENPVTGQLQNSTCAAQAGIEYWNFAFITKDGRSQAPANPLQSTLTTFTPDPAKDLFMNSGDKMNVAVHDTSAGVQVVLDDKTSHQSGSMTASAANGFAQVKFDPTGTSCTAIPNNFHPMYSTSSPQTRVIWAAHTYNVALGYGAHLPGSNTNFGRNAQYGSLLGTTYLRFGGGGASRTLFTNFRQIFTSTPCRA